MKLHFVSLGCDKNLADSEHMLYLLHRDGFEITDDENEAEVIVVNTCCFIQAALEESINTILELVHLKEDGVLKALLVTGCMAERYEKEMREELPEVDAILGTSSYDDIVDAVHVALKGEYKAFMKPLDSLPDDSAGRMLTTGGHFAYLKIAEGCNKHCTYCIIPSLRGNYRSIPKELIIAEAKKLVSDGVKELILVAQETTLYGVDLYGHKALSELISELNQIEELKWIRLLYCYPEEIDDELISSMRDNSKVVHYIDMPIQHISDNILGRMGRKTSKQDIIDKINALRQAMPDIAIRTSVICGFPGETDEDHEELLSFIKEANIDRLGAFTYSREDGTPAAELDNQLEESLKEAYLEDVMLTQQEVSFAKNESLIGTEMELIIEGRIPEDNVYVARSYRDTPNVDSLVFLTNAEKEYMTGDFVNANITDFNEYDLIGEIIYEYTK